ncbi:hypothetical protein GW891_00710 [bacterium]|nr:hypothetical protein [bacterium]
MNQNNKSKKNISFIVVNFLYNTFLYMYLTVPINQKTSINQTIQVIYDNIYSQSQKLDKKYDLIFILSKK